MLEFQGSSRGGSASKGESRLPRLRLHSENSEHSFLSQLARGKWSGNKRRSRQRR